MNRPVITPGRPARPAVAGARGWHRVTDRVPVGRLAGFPIYLSPSWLLLAAALIVGYGRLLRGDGPPLVSYLLAAGLVGCLVVSVLLHELGHALACRHFGIGVRAVTVEMLGGYTEMDRDPADPRTEAAVSLAGPAVSLCLGLCASAVVAVTPRHTVGHQVAFQVAASNLLIAVFNSLPGLPLDGGRALSALVWAGTGDPYRGTRVAGWVGRGVALACLGVAVALGVRDLPGLLADPGGGHGGAGLVAAVAVAVVAVGVAQGAGQAVRLGRLGARLPLLDVSALARPIFRVPAGTALDEAHRRAERAGAGAAALGVADEAGALVAVVDARADAAVPAGRRASVPVDEVARGLDGRVLPARLRGADVFEAVRADPTGDYLVASGEDVVGVLRGVDVANLLTSRETAR
jgi:Zn-dependent protease